MADWRQYIVLGRVGSEPELRYTQSGVAVCSFSLVCNESWTDKQSGEKREVAHWHRVSAWRQLAEISNQYVRKGMQVMVVGTVEARGYTNNNNEPSASLELTARDIQFLGGRDGGNGGDDYQPDGTEDQIPF